MHTHLKILFLNEQSLGMETKQSLIISLPMKSLLSVSSQYVTTQVVCKTKINSPRELKQPLGYKRFTSK